MPSPSERYYERVAAETSSPAPCRPFGAALRAPAPRAAPAAGDRVGVPPPSTSTIRLPHTVVQVGPPICPPPRLADSELTPHGFAAHRDPPRVRVRRGPTVTARRLGRRGHPGEVDPFGVLPPPRDDRQATRPYSTGSALDLTASSRRQGGDQTARCASARFSRANPRAEADDRPDDREEATSSAGSPRTTSLSSATGDEIVPGRREVLRAAPGSGLGIARLDRKGSRIRSRRCRRRRRSHDPPAQPYEGNSGRQCSA